MSRLLNKSWLEAYKDYTQDTENPTSYNEWCGISAISATLKRNVFIYYHNIKFFANQYIVLVGPPGLGKGSSIIPATRLVKEAGTANYLSDRITAERIIEKLADGFTHAVVQSVGALAVKEHTACILAKELPVFLGSSDWMHSLLCQLWDENEFEHQTKNKGNKFIRDMCVSMLGGCVPDYIRKLTKDTLAPVTGGFTARCIFVYATQKSQLLADGWGQPNGNHASIEHKLIEDLKHMSRITGEMYLDDNAKRTWNSMYGQYGKPSEFESDALANFKSRIPSHVIKTAITISLADNDKLIITDEHLQRAIKLIEEVKNNVDVTFRAVGESPMAVSQARIMQFIEARGVCSQREILKYNHRHVTDEQLTAILKVLEFIGHSTIVWRGNHAEITHNPNFRTSP